MKITGFYNRESQEKGFLVWPDSVWIRNGKPMFLPEEDEPFFILFAPCLRVDKVGKSVVKKFANRYYSEMCYSAVMLNKRAYQRLHDGKDPYAMDICADCCVITGNFKDKSLWENLKNINISFFPLFLNKGARSVTENEQIDTSQLFEKADEAISEASRLNTLKTGDLIIPELPKTGFEAIIDTKVELMAEDSELLTFKIK